MMRSRNWRQHLHSQLSKAQKEAVMHKDGPMMVLAGPGSGKTLVITKRIQYLISHYQIPPQRILVITFTRAAANEMKERFWRLAGETLPVSFGTFHSVFFTILKYAYHYSADNILPEHKKYDFIREIITDHELEIDDEADFMRQIIQEISLVKGQMIPLAYYHSGCCGDEVFKEIYRAYEEKLHENRWIDFDDIISAFPFIFQDFKRFQRIVGSNDAIGNFAVDEACSRFVAYVAECDEVAVGRHTVGTAGASIGGCKRSERKIVHKIDFLQRIVHLDTHGGPCRTYVLEGSGGGQSSCFFQFFY